MKTEKWGIAKTAQITQGGYTALELLAVVIIILILLALLLEQQTKMASRKKTSARFGNGFSVKA